MSIVSKSRVATITGLTLGFISVFGLLSESAHAHRDCYKQSLGVPGSWTWVCKPHVHSPSTPESTTGVERWGRQRAYCSGANNNSAWIQWGANSKNEACQTVRNKFRSWGKSIDRIYSDTYYEKVNYRVRISCANGYVDYVTGTGGEAFRKALNARPNNSCTFNIVSR